MSDKTSYRSSNDYLKYAFDKLFIIFRGNKKQNTFDRR